MYKKTKRNKAVAQGDTAMLLPQGSSKFRHQSEKDSSHGS